MVNRTFANAGFARRARKWLLAAVAVVALSVVVNYYVETDPTNLAFQAFFRASTRVGSLHEMAAGPGTDGIYNHADGREWLVTLKPVIRPGPVTMPCMARTEQVRIQDFALRRGLMKRGSLRIRG